MPIASLLQIMPPPPSPVEIDGSWSEVEETLAIHLPNDFKEFTRAYGTGTIGHFITVLNPFSERANINLVTQSKRQLDALRRLAGDFGEQRPYELYPAPGGLLPVAMTDNGDVVHWLTNGTADDWNIVVNEARSADYEEFGCNLITFLTGVLNGTLRCRAFPTELFGSDRQFHSF